MPVAVGDLDAALNGKRACRSRDPATPVPHQECRFPRGRTCLQVQRTRLLIAGSSAIVDAPWGESSGVARRLHLPPSQRHVVLTAPVTGGRSSQQATAMSQFVAGSNHIGL